MSGGYEWVDVTLEKEEPTLVVDKDGRLTILDQVSGEYRDWASTVAAEDVLISLNIFRHSDYGLPIVKVLGINRLKSTGHYRVKIRVAYLRVAYRGSPTLTTWNVLMDDTGLVLKKARCDYDDDENRLHF